MANDAMDKFYNELQTVPKLISDLALGVAEAQRRLDTNYLENLAEFMRVVSSTLGPAGAAGGAAGAAAGMSADQLQGLFHSMAPSRYQFTETVVEVRADLQMGSQSEFSGGANIGVKGGMFAVAINASYSRRTAYDAKSAALIRTVLNAIPADPGVLDKLIPRAGPVGAVTEPKSERFKELADAFKSVKELAPPAKP